MPIPAGGGAGVSAVGVDALTTRPAAHPVGDAYVDIDNWVAPGVDDSGVEWICTSVEGWNGTPLVRGAGEDRPEAHGQFDSPNFYGARVITISGTAQAPSREACMAAQDTMASIAAWDSAALFPLRIAEPGRPTRQCLVRLDADTKISTVYDGQAFDWQLSLRAPDPLRYAAAETVLNLVLPAPVGGVGLTAPLTAPFYAPTPVLSAIQADAINAGSFDTTAMTAVFTGPVTNPTLTNTRSGLSLGFNIDLAAGVTIAADFSARTALLNGVTPVGHTLAPTARWWPLKPGVSTLALGGLGGPGSGVEFRYRSAWL